MTGFVLAAAFVTTLAMFAGPWAVIKYVHWGI